MTQVSGIFYTKQARTLSLTLLAAELQYIYIFKGEHAWVPFPKRADAIFLTLIFLDGLKHLEEVKFNKCIYIEDACLERLTSIENLQESLYMMEVVSCGNVTDKGIIALHKLRSVFIVCSKGNKFKVLLVLMVLFKKKKQSYNEWSN